MKKTFYIAAMLGVITASVTQAQIWGINNSRTDGRDDAGLQGSAGAMSGFYQTTNPVNYPAGASNWWHLLDVRHDNPTNNFAMQFAGGFFDQNLYFRKTNNNPAQAWSRVLLETNGLTGVGTLSPVFRFNVAQDLSMNADVDVAQVGISGSSDNAKRLVLGYDVNGAGFGFIKAGWYQHQWTNLSLQPNGGNVGIGTTSPNGRLHIDGSLDGSLSTIRIGSAAAGNINVPVGASTGGYNIDFHTWRDIVPDQIGARIRAERINGFQPDNALIQSMELAFYTSYGQEQSQLTEKLRIKSNGFVGIGTSNPDAKLTVDGTIHSREVKVDTSIPVPDYVFNKDYTLMPLADVEKYISVNKHLPEIPAAKVIEKEGVNLSEMNLKLLKKVEELTLYLIEKDKKDKNQEAKLRKQQNQLNDLHQKLNKLLNKKK